MKVFLDANVLIAVLNKEYPLFSTAARVLSLQDDKRFMLVTSPLCLAIAFYFAEKKSGTNLARTKIALLVSRLQIAASDAETVRQAVADKRIHDFEDGLEYYAAVQSACEIIITEDKGDFYFSDLPVYSCADFLTGYVFGN
ncbi:PIN domain-containing protein [Parapedobacter tibetensis]|uniref:PIN domain-containing protein n=1 Tax=Parapedobacter tibetensis TaxID=2972951 RepID=UPI00214D6A77|nr:PIN domain-containing protein [Parapedobacter tibetensis]